MRKRLTAFLCAVIIVINGISILSAAAETERLPAFPGAEGGGKYATGARAVEKPEIYHVTTLNNMGPGSLTEAVSQGNTIVVFDVSGTISYDTWKQLRVESNTTILGQTAPGDGITIEGNDLRAYSGKSNMIIRYLKVRPGDRIKEEMDGIFMWYSSDVIIDHCSVSWAVDELVSIYSGNSENKNYPLGKDITVQNCLISEALNLSSHQKGEHGYGSIFGSDNSTLYHNVYAHNKSRNPAIYREIQNVNVANNVIYNWGGTPSYGGQPHSINHITFVPSSINYINNFYKWGPSSGAETRNMFFNVENETQHESKSSFYFDGNVYDGADAVTQNNILGVINADKAVILENPIDLGEYGVPQETAYETYDGILDTVGAYLPKRDAIDAKVIADIKNGTGQIINSPKEVGGYIDVVSEYRRFEIPQEWKELNSMGGAEENDLVMRGKYKGYTWIEAYVFDMEEQSVKPANPDVIIQSPAIESNNNTVMGLNVQNGKWKVINEGESFKLKATAIFKEGTEIINVEIYDGNVLVKGLGAVENIDIDIMPKSGTHYYTLRVYNDKGEATNSPTAIVCVNPAGILPEGYSYTSLGNPPYKDYGKASVDENGIYTVGGSGRITAKKNNCGFLYRPVSGDFSIVVKPEEIPKYKDRIRAGLMITDKIGENSRLAMLSDNLDRMGENVFVVSRTYENEDVKQALMCDKYGNEVGNSDGGYDPLLDRFRMPEYIRIDRNGDLIKFSVSDDGVDFTNNPRQPFVVKFENLPQVLYVGLGVESNPGTYPKPLYSMARFSDLRLIEYDKLVQTERWEIEEVKNNTITVSNKLNDGEITPDGKRINVYSAEYEIDGDGEKRLQQCAVGSFVTDRYIDTYEVMLDGEVNAESGNIKVFLWDDDMKPVLLRKQADMAF